MFARLGILLLALTLVVVWVQTWRVDSTAQQKETPLATTSQASGRARDQLVANDPGASGSATQTTRTPGANASSPRVRVIDRNGMALVGLPVVILIASNPEPATASEWKPDRFTPVDPEDFPGSNEELPVEVFEVLPEELSSTFGSVPIIERLLGADPEEPPPPWDHDGLLLQTHSITWGNPPEGQPFVPNELPRVTHRIPPWVTGSPDLSFASALTNELGEIEVVAELPRIRELSNLVVTPAVPLERPFEAKLDRREDGAFVIVAPPLVAYDVVVLDDLSNTSDACEVRLAQRWRNQKGEVEWITWSDWCPTASEPQRFWVGPGVDAAIHLRLNRAFAPIRVIELAHDEPRSSEDPHRMTIRLSERFGRVRARIVDANGRPPNDRTFEAALGCVKGRTVHERRGTIELDEEGRLDLWLEPMAPDTFARRLVLARSTEQQISGEITKLLVKQLEGRTTAGTFDLVASECAPSYIDLTTCAVAGRVYDLGDISMGSGPVLLHGIVVDPHERPVPEARVEVRGLSPEDDRPGTFTQHQVTSRADGTFEIVGFDDAETLVAHAMREGFTPSVRTRHARGETNVRIELDLAGTLVGRILFREDVVRALDDAPARVLVSAVDRKHNRSIEARIEAGGRFRLANLPAGVIDLHVLLDGWMLHAVRGLTVRSGEETTDAGLEPLDLRDVLGTIRLRNDTLEEQRIRIEDQIANMTRESMESEEDEYGNVHVESSTIETRAFTSGLTLEPGEVATFLVPAHWQHLLAVRSNGPSIPLAVSSDVQMIGGQ